MIQVFRCNCGPAHALLLATSELLKEVRAASALTTKNSHSMLSAELPVHRQDFVDECWQKNTPLEARDNTCGVMHDPTMGFQSLRPQLRGPVN